MIDVDIRIILALYVRTRRPARLAPPLGIYDLDLKSPDFSVAVEAPDMVSSSYE